MAISSFLYCHGGRHEVQRAFHGALQEHIDGKEAVYFVGAFEDTVNAGYRGKRGPWGPSALKPMPP